MFARPYFHQFSFVRLPIAISQNHMDPLGPLDPLDPLSLLSPLDILNPLLPSGPRELLDPLDSVPYVPLQTIWFLWKSGSLGHRTLDSADTPNSRVLWVFCIPEPPGHFGPCAHLHTVD